MDHTESTADQHASAYRKAFCIALAVTTISIGLAAFPLDDGLRHVGQAFGLDRSWGETYPFSVFAGHKGYDPWLGHDLVLRGVAWLVRPLHVTRLFAQFLVAQLFSLAFLGLLLYLVTTRSRVLSSIANREALLVALGLVVLLLAPPILRIAAIRPFAYGTFFILYALGRTGATRGLISTGALFFFYPYLAWLYSVPVALAHLLRGSRRFALGAALATGAGIALQPRSFWGMVLALFHSDAVRDELAPRIGEFASVLDHPVLLGVYLLLWLVLIPFTSAESKRLRMEHILLLLFLPPSLKYIRYFLDIELCLLFVAYGQEVIRVTHRPVARITGYWADTLRSAARRLSRRSATDNVKQAATHRTLMPYIVGAYCLLLPAMALVGYVNHVKLVRFHDQLAAVPPANLVLTEFNLQYKILYARPDLRVIPSSEIGFPAEAISDEYRAYLNRGDVCGLALKVKADYFVESRSMYMDPGRISCLTLVRDENELRIWQVSSPPGPS